MEKSDLDFFKNLIGDIDSGFGKEYNIFCFSEAVKIATKLCNKDEIIKFHKEAFETQVKMVPDLDNSHSGNTFDMSCRLAISYLPQLLVNKRDGKIDKIIN